MQCKCKRSRFDLKDGTWLFAAQDGTDEDALVDLGFLVGAADNETVHCPACGTALWADGYAGEKEATA